MRRWALIVVLVATGWVLLLAIGWIPTLRYDSSDCDLWIGVDHRIGQETVQPVQRMARAFHLGDFYVGRGWRTQPQNSGMYTLTALDGATIPFWLQLSSSCIAAFVVWWLVGRRR